MALTFMGSLVISSKISPILYASIFIFWSFLITWIIQHLLRCIPILTAQFFVLDKF